LKRSKRLRANRVAAEGADSSARPRQQIHNNRISLHVREVEGISEKVTSVQVVERKEAPAAGVVEEVGREAGRDLRVAVEEVDSSSLAADRTLHSHKR
jgi:hypothetical protein